MLRQYPLTSAAGKRLIARALLQHPWVARALTSSRLILVAGTTNGYLAEEILHHLGQSVGFSRRHFFRGLTLPPSLVAALGSRPADDGRFPGDVVIDRGVWQRAQTIFDVAALLGPADVIVKGANALDLAARQAATFVDTPDSGPTGAVLPAVLGRHARLLVPVGLEKRVPGSLFELDQRLSQFEARGLRLCPLPGLVFTEIEAIALLTGANASLVGAGGVAGAEGAIWLAVEGTAEQITQLDNLLDGILGEPGFAVEA